MNYKLERFHESYYRLRELTNDKSLEYLIQELDTSYYFMLYDAKERNAYFYLLGRIINNCYLPYRSNGFGVNLVYGRDLGFYDARRDLVNHLACNTKLIRLRID